MSSHHILLNRHTVSGNRTALAVVLSTLLLNACQSEQRAAATAPEPALARPDAIVVTKDSFKCIHDMTPVRGFFVDNIAGDLDATLAVATSPTGGVYPPGSVVQLFPNEVMVKREKNFNPITKDWEFFELDVDENGSTIRNRGFQDVINRFDDNCFACHVRAKPEWDMICENDHGCEALTVSRHTIESLQNTDPRCAESNATFSQSVTAWFIKAFTSL